MLYSERAAGRTNCRRCTICSPWWILRLVSPRRCRVVAEVQASNSADAMLKAHRMFKVDATFFARPKDDPTVPLEAVPIKVTP